MKFDKEITLLGEEYFFDYKKKLDIMRKYGNAAAFTDFAIVLGCNITSNTFYTADGRNLEDRACNYWTSTPGSSITHYNTVGVTGNSSLTYAKDFSVGIRPSMSIIDMDIEIKGIRNKFGILEVEYGEFPQQSVQNSLSKILERDFQLGKLKVTGKEYSINFMGLLNNGEPNSKTNEEYEYNGKKYVRTQAFVFHKYQSKPIILSNGSLVKNSDFVWTEVKPIIWLIDEKEFIAISKKTLFSGMTFCNKFGDFVKDFNKSLIYQYLQLCFKKEIMPYTGKNKTHEEMELCTKQQREFLKKLNPFNLSFDYSNEEEKLRGIIKSGIAVFLHGNSNEDKISVLKQIDPLFETISLHDVSFESLNGNKMVNVITGEKIDVKPLWLTIIEEKCMKEPDKYHIVFFDELENANIDVQVFVLNLALNRKVNGLWKLPNLVGIVVSGYSKINDLEANELKNSFANVYIKTTSESLLNWAKKNNIHPAVYSYIAYRIDENKDSIIDFNKWEKVSKLLYSTVKLLTFFSIIDDGLADDFVSFYNQKVITINDVINNRFTVDFINDLSNLEKYATVMVLSQVDDENFQCIQNFISYMGLKFEMFFDNLRLLGDKSRLDNGSNIVIDSYQKESVRKLVKKE